MNSIKKIKTNHMKKIILSFFLFLLLPNAVLAEKGAVSVADPRAAEAGVAMLRQGGSAADAALAMMVALSVVEPQSSGIGGGGFFIYNDPQTGLPATIFQPASRPGLSIEEMSSAMDARSTSPSRLSASVPSFAARSTSALPNTEV